MRSRRVSGKSAHGFIRAASVPRNLDEVARVRIALDEDLPPAVLQERRRVAEAEAKVAQKAEEARASQERREKAQATEVKKVEEAKRLARRVSEATEVALKRLRTHGGALPRTSRLVAHYLEMAKVANAASALASITKELQRAAWSDLSEMSPKVRAVARKDVRIVLGIARGA